MDIFQNEWREVTVTPPPRDELVLCWNPMTEYPKICGIELQGTALGISIDFGWSCNVTHWMPLPEPPKMNKGECN